MHAATVRATVLAVLLVTLAACGSVAPATPRAEATAPTAPTAPPASEPASQPAAPTPIPDAQPPDALLVGVAAGPVAGDLGTFTWAGLTSDSPWVVGRAGGSADAGATLAVEFRPDVGEATWVTTWARLAGGEAQQPDDVSDPATGPVRVTLPAEPGTWSLQLFARFGSGRDAAWYWRVEVAP
jgi:hypothetical protein